MTPPRLRTLVLGLILIGILFVGFFGMRALRSFGEFRRHRPPPPAAAEWIEIDVGLIRDWMTIPFISKMYQVPANILFDALGIPANRNREKSLKQLNEEYFPQAEGIVLEKVRAAVLANRPRQIEDEIPAVPITPTSPNLP